LKQLSITKFSYILHLKFHKILSIPCRFCRFCLFSKPYFMCKFLLCRVPWRSKQNSFCSRQADAGISGKDGKER